jgi:hypothetical protein
MIARADPIVVPIRQSEGRGDDRNHPVFAQTDGIEQRVSRCRLRTIMSWPTLDR